MTERKILPQRRPCTTVELTHGNHRTRFYVTLGYYPNGSVGEVFVSGPKAGSHLEAVARDAAVILSLAIQYGVPIAAIRSAITREPDGQAASIIGQVVDMLVEK
jgi:hypothetical protein